jgi:hypothetical protein
MRLRVPVIVLVVALLALGAGCGDDSDSDETRAGDSESPSSTTSSSESSAPSTSSTSEPAQGGSMPSRPAELTGEVTDSQGGRFLVEEQPDAADAGRKAWVAIDGPVFRTASGRGEPTPAAASDIEQGQQVSVWTGICAESYPEQCGAEAFLIH